jgi:hypothetical protein
MGTGGSGLWRYTLTATLAALAGAGAFWALS